MREEKCTPSLFFFLFFFNCFFFIINIRKYYQVNYLIIYNTCCGFDIYWKCNNYLFQLIKNYFTCFFFIINIRKYYQVNYLIIYDTCCGFDIYWKCNNYLFQPIKNHWRYIYTFNKYNRIENGIFWRCFWKKKAISAKVSKKTIFQ